MSAQRDVLVMLESADLKALLSYQARSLELPEITRRGGLNWSCMSAVLMRASAARP